MPSKRVSLKGKGADLFFGSQPPSEMPSPDDVQVTDTRDADQRFGERSTAGIAVPSGSPAHAILTQPRQHDAQQWESNRDMSGSNPDAEHASAETVERIRKTVKEIGREVAFTRLSPTEKGRLADIVYTYRRQGVKTSENEINRIAINLMLNDYEVNGEQSVLARVLAALQA